MGPQKGSIHMYKQQHFYIYMVRPSGIWMPWYARQLELCYIMV